MWFRSGQAQGGYHANQLSPLIDRSARRWHHAFWDGLIPASSSALQIDANGPKLNLTLSGTSVGLHDGTEYLPNII